MFYVFTLFRAYSESLGSTLNQKEDYGEWELKKETIIKEWEKFIYK